MKAKIELELGRLGHDFLEDVLGGRQSPVADMIRKSSKNGKFFAVLPKPVPIDDIRDLNEGGEGKKANIEQYFCNSAMEYLKGGKKEFSAFVFDPDAKITDLCADNETGIMHSFLDDDVMYSVDIFDEEICQIYLSVVRKKCISFYFILIMFGIDNEEVSKLAVNDPNKLGKYLQMLMINAFDQDGVIIWRRQPEP